MSKTAVYGGTSRFYSFLSQCGRELYRPDSIRDALVDGDCDSLIIAPEYDKGKEIVDQLSLEDTHLLAKRKREGFRVYAENYDTFNYYQASIFGFEVCGDVCHVSTESLYANDGFQHKLNGDRILQAFGAAYIPAILSHRDPYVRAIKSWLLLGDFLGTSRTVTKPDPSCITVLARTGSVISAMISISKFDSANFRPNDRWRKVFGSIFSYVLNVPESTVFKAFDLTYPPIAIRYPLDKEFDPTEWKGVCERAFRDAADWHVNSGIVLGDHGEGGAVEMIMSTCGQKLYTNRRVDAGMYTGWTLYSAGKYFGDRDLLKTGENVFRYFANNCQLENGRQDGLYTWCYNQDAGPHDIYSIDCGRDGIALCNMYRELGDPEILERIRRLADGFMRWMVGDLLADNHLVHDEIPTDAPYEGIGRSRTPAVYAEMTSFMIMASRLLDDRKYMDTVIKIADKIAMLYPNFDVYGHTTSSERARMLMQLLCVHLTGERDYTELINEAINYLNDLIQPCGAIYSEDNILFERGIVHTENGITLPWEKDIISDQLYCVNNALAALSLVRELHDDTGINKELALDIQRRLLEYVVKIQIVDDDKRFKGGWMRAFSISHGEYYGLARDRFWGPYCIMAGWTMGIIPMAIHSELTGECPYVI